MLADIRSQKLHISHNRIIRLSTFDRTSQVMIASTHHKNDEKCKSHYIRAVVLEDMVWMHMETVISYILHYEDHFRAVVQDS